MPAACSARPTDCQWGLALESPPARGPLASGSPGARGPGACQAGSCCAPRGAACRMRLRAGQSRGSGILLARSLNGRGHGGAELPHPASKWATGPLVLPPRRSESERRQVQGGSGRREFNRAPSLSPQIIFSGKNRALHSGNQCYAEMGLITAKRKASGLQSICLDFADHCRSHNSM